MQQQLPSGALYKDTMPYGRIWSFSIADLTGAEVYVSRRGEWQQLQGRLAVFLPPYSLVEWSACGDGIAFDSILSTLPLPSWVPKEPVAFAYSGPTPQVVEAIWPILSAPQGLFQIGKEEMPSALARKTKAWIDGTADEGVQFRLFARRLGVFPSALSRAFKQCYGLSPLQYRLRLRVTDSVWLLLMKGFTVTEAATNLGFSDVSHFVRSFKKRILNSPARFSTRRRGSAKS